ncbi:MAG: SAM-dependent methyltransferase [Tepidiformaceae bacterium]
MTSTTDALAPVRAALEAGIEGGWLKAVFSHPSVPGIPWAKLTVEPVRLSAGPAMKVVMFEAERQQTKTVPLERWPTWLGNVMLAGPSHINIVGRTSDWHARQSKRGRWLVSKGKPSLGVTAPAAPIPAHDRPSQHLLPSDAPEVQRLFVETGLFGLNGQLRGEAADKYRQVQHYIELLRPLAVLQPAGGPGERVRIVDAGCGKAYLSLALFLYAQRQGLEPELIGVDSNAAMVETVAAIAAKLKFESTRFVAQTIGAFAEQEEPADLLVSLHACDTATDEALAAGVRLGADAIVLVPCCQHELVSQLEARAKDGLLAESAWAAVLRSGLLTQRLADILTDALRAAALEAMGYKVEVAEFVSPEATARNVMLRAEKRPAGAQADAANARGLLEYSRLRDAWEVAPSVERLLGDRWPG